MQKVLLAVVIQLKIPHIPKTWPKLQKLSRKPAKKKTKTKSKIQQKNVNSIRAYALGALPVRERDRAQKGEGRERGIDACGLTLTKHNPQLLCSSSPHTHTHTCTNRLINTHTQRKHFQAEWQKFVENVLLACEGSRAWKLKFVQLRRAVKMFIQMSTGNAGGRKEWQGEGVDT